MHLKSTNVKILLILIIYERYKNYIYKNKIHNKIIKK